MLIAISLILLRNALLFTMYSEFCLIDATTGIFFVRLGQNSGSPKTQVQAKTQLFHGKTQVPVSLGKKLF